MTIIIDDQTPESIAARIFNNKPAPIKSYEILPDLDDNYDDIDEDIDIFTYAFEILATIFMEGLMIAKSHNFKIAALTLADIEQLSPWFESFGYTIRAYDDIVDKFYDKPTSHYARVIFRSNPNDYHIFDNIDTDKAYHFLINGQYRQIHDISQIELVIYKPATTHDHNEHCYTIRFKQLE